MARILIVDPDVYVGELFSVILEASGHFVQTVQDGLAAVRELQSSSYGILISEKNVPMRSGFELIQFARMSGLSSSARCFLLTSHITQIDGLRAKSLDVLRVFQKPFAPADLALSVERALRSPPLDLQA